MTWLSTKRFKDYCYWALASILVAYPFSFLVGARESLATVLVQGVVAAIMVLLPTLFFWFVIVVLLRKSFSWTIPTLLTVIHILFMSLSNIAYTMLI